MICVGWGLNPHPHIIFKFHIYIIYMTSKGIPKNKDVGKDPYYDQ